MFLEAAIKVLRQILWVIWLLLHNSDLGQLLGNCSHLKVKDKSMWTDAYTWVKSVIIWTCRCYLHLLYNMNIRTFQRQRVNALQLKPTKREISWTDCIDSMGPQDFAFPWGVSAWWSAGGGKVRVTCTINKQQRDTVGSWGLGKRRDLIGRIIRRKSSEKIN